MNVISEPLKIFVAMPGTDMGDNATWKEPDQIKKYFFEKVRKSLEEKLSREVILEIEKDKDKPGSIYSSMFGAAWNSDVYIADLTGANPNVYLELGVRWAVKDNITIIVCQDINEIRFNAATIRAIQYGENLAVMDLAIEKVIRSIMSGLEDRDHIDSPVRESGDLKTIEKKHYEDLIEENNRLRSERGEELLNVAMKTYDTARKISLLEQAIKINPLYVEAIFEMGVTLRKIGQYEKSIEYFQKAVTTNPKYSSAHCELGIAQSKVGEYETAAQSLKNAIDLNPNDFAAQSALGGVYRRIAMQDAPTDIDWEILRSSRDCYEKAGELNPHDTYPLLNVARIDLLLSRIEPEKMNVAKQAFDELQDLCSYEVRKAKSRLKKEGTQSAREMLYWRLFDYADTLLFSEKIPKAKLRFREGINHVPTEEQKSVFASVMSPLKNYLAAEVVDNEIEEAIKEIINKMEQMIK